MLSSIASFQPDEMGDQNDRQVFYLFFFFLFFSSLYIFMATRVYISSLLKRITKKKQQQQQQLHARIFQHLATPCQCYIYFIYFHMFLSQTIEYLPSCFVCNLFVHSCAMLCIYCICFQYFKARQPLVIIIIATATVAALLLRL